ncbi:ArsR family transcriptional regulator [Planococcus maritimus]|uniref:ArsR family transcriptional regulator n=1 Tax=Planococcus maritimus TaxID=192421 RepID=A0A7D7MJI8_PLAMR|nr:ArsR family transcriptional regulator [Planococcus maritimus]QMT18208.1 ArsR family transcriptional regulator [Planococcus maritimus]
MTSNYDLMKLISDPKIEAILYSVKSKDKTVKEIAAELNDKPSRLYYPIQKLLTTELIKISEEKQIGNLIEKYYTSRHLFNEEEVMKLEGEMAIKNAASLLTHALWTFNKGLNLLKSDLEKTEFNKDQDYSRAMYGEMTVSLTNSEWVKVNEEIRKLIRSRSKEDLSETKEYTFSLLTYENDQESH